MKYSKRIAKKIIQLYSSGQYTISSVCEAVGINRDTFYVWKKSKPEFVTELDEIEPKRLEFIRDAARSGLMVLLQGKEYEEVTTEFIEGKPDKDGNTKPKIKLQRKVKKFILPNPTSVIFALKNLDNENFADTLKQEFSGPDGKPLDIRLVITPIGEYLPLAKNESEVALNNGNGRHI